MTGAFNCVPVPCQQCAESALAIQRTDASTWAGKIATLPRRIARVRSRVFARNLAKGEG